MIEYRPVPSPDDLATLLDTHAKRRAVGYLNPQKSLRSLHDDIDRFILPQVSSLILRNDTVRYVLSDNVKATISTEKKAVVEPAVRDAKRTKKLAERVEREANKIRHELGALPEDSDKRPKLLKALELRNAEIELMVKRMGRSSDQIQALLDKARQQLLPPVTDIYTRGKQLEKTLTRALWSMTLSSVGARTLIAMPYVIALVTTLTVDRIKSVLDPLAVGWAPKEHHDLLLLAFFGLQLFLLTPITTNWNAKLCWRSFDRTMKLVGTLLPEIDNIDKQMAADEERAKSLFAESGKTKA